MNLAEDILLLSGISIDIFVAMECKGSLVGKIDKKHLLRICTLVSCWQVIALLAGGWLSGFIQKSTSVHAEYGVGMSLVILLLTELGGRFVFKAIRNEYVIERLETGIDLGQYMRIAARTGFYTALAGLSFGFLKMNMGRMSLLVLLMSVLVVVGGLYTGYHYGFQSKKKAYILGAVILWGMEIILLIKVL